MPRGHGSARYRHKDQRAAYDLVDGRDLMDEDRGKDDGDDYLHRAEQARHSCWDILQRGEENAVCDETARKSLQSHERKARYREIGEVSPAVPESLEDEQQHEADGVREKQQPELVDLMPEGKTARDERLPRHTDDREQPPEKAGKRNIQHCIHAAAHADENAAYYEDAGQTLKRSRPLVRYIERPRDGGERERVVNDEGLRH